MIAQARKLDPEVRVAEPLGTAIAEIVLDRYADALVIEELGQYA